MNLIGRPVIVRCDSAAAHYGTLVRLDDNSVELTDARRIWYWEGAATLSELAQRGTSRPTACRWPCPVDYVILRDWCEIIAVSSEAVQSLAQIPVWSGA